MTIIRYLILALTIWYIPSILTVGYGSGALGSLTSHMTYGLLVVYYLMVKKGQPPWIFIVFAILFFAFTGLSFMAFEPYYMADLKKYLILLIAGAEVVRNTTLREMYFFLLLGASSILIHAAVFGESNGRYFGFYLDPNAAGFICLLGVCISYGFKNDKWRLLGLFFLTFCGLLTFSRTFMLLWFITNCIAVIQDRKNVNVMAMGFGVLLLIISLATIFQVNTKRLTLIESLLGNEQVKSYEAKEDVRTETWAMHYARILEDPLIGHGYGSFTMVEGMVGVHNVYLRIIGEGGIIPLLVFISIYLLMLKRSLGTFYEKPYQLMLVIAIMALLLTTHNFINGNQFITIVSIWLYLDLRRESNEETNLNLAKI